MCESDPASANRSLPASFQNDVEPSWMVSACSVVMSAFRVGNSASIAVLRESCRSRCFCVASKARTEALIPSVSCWLISERTVYRRISRIAPIRTEVTRSVAPNSCVRRRSRIIKPPGATMRWVAAWLRQEQTCSRHRAPLKNIVDCLGQARVSAVTGECDYQQYEWRDSCDNPTLHSTGRLVRLRARETETGTSEL